MLEDLAAKGQPRATSTCACGGGGIFFGLWRGEEAERRGLEEVL